MAWSKLFGYDQLGNKEEVIPDDTKEVRAYLLRCNKPKELSHSLALCIQHQICNSLANVDNIENKLVGYSCTVIWESRNISSELPAHVDKGSID